MLSVYIRCYNSAMAKQKRRRRLRVGRLLALLLAAVLSVGVLAVFVSGIVHVVQEIVSPSEPAVEPEPTPTPDPTYRNSYGWQYVKEDENGFLSYEDDTYTSRLGIDVSHYQGNIDWNAVHEAGVEFAFIRAGYRGHTTGELHEDTGYRDNIQRALDADVEIAVYFFSQANGAEEAVEEANYVMELIKDYPIHVVAFDLEFERNEGRLKDTTQDACTEAAAAFCKTLNDNGYTPLVYGSVSFLTHEIRMHEIQDQTQFWLAWYDDKEPPFPYAFTIWQYSCEGTVPGIETAVDMNILMVKK